MCFLLKYAALCVILRGVKKQSKKLPKAFYPYFWEINPARLDIKKSAYYIVEKILHFGDQGAVHWMFQTYPVTLIKQVLRHSRGLDKRSGNFWAGIFDIRRERVRCLNKPLLLRHSPF